MPAETSALTPLAPILAVVTAGLVVMVLDMWRPADHRLATVATVIGLVGALFLTAQSWRSGPQTAFTSPGGAPLVVVDPFAIYVWFVVLVAAVLTVAVGVRYRQVAGLEAGEHLPLLAFTTAGMLLLAAANDLVLVFLALETFSLGLYVLTGFRRGDTRAQEAALKYFVLGSFSAAFLLYGAALLYTALGTTNLSSLGAALTGSAAATAGVAAGTVGLDAGPVVIAGPLVLAGFALVIAALAFKLGLVPFHQWTPDVYTGASAPIAGFMSAATKAAAVAVLVRVLWVAFPTVTAWRPALAAVALVTLVVGNFVALVQSDLKRMLGYSAVAHAGVILVAVVAGPPNGTMAALFYLVAYALTSLGAFAVIAVLGPRADGLDASSLDDLRGLARRNPGVAFALTVFLASLAGLPPTAGFLAKWYVFRAAVGADLTWLAVAVVLTSVVAAFTYLRPVALMYFGSAEADSPLSPPAPEAFAVALPAVVVVLALVLGVPLARAAAAAAVPGQGRSVTQDKAPPAQPSGNLLFTAPNFEKRPPISAPVGAERAATPTKVPPTAQIGMPIVIPTRAP